MLVLSRKLGEDIQIGHDITVRIIRLRSGDVRIGIMAPKGIPIHRGEIAKRIQLENLKNGLPIDTHDGEPTDLNT
jgi:carbon storage regulator